MLDGYLKELKHLRLYVITNVAVIGLSYSVYLFFDYDTIAVLAREDGFFENLTVVFFVLASVLFFMSFRRTKNIFLLGLALLVFVFAGEEISWGQRIFHFGTPAVINEVNVQHEFNIHNVEAINYRDFAGVSKTGWRRFTDINFLYRLFSLIFFVGVPLFFSHIKLRVIVRRSLQMPVPPFTIGIFFFISWAILSALRVFLLPPNRVPKSYEIFECTAAYMYFIVALYFYNRKDNNFLGKDIKKTLL